MTVWLLSVHNIVWDLSDFRLRKKMQEDHCLVSCCTVYSGREAPLQMSLLPQTSSLLEPKVSVKHCCCFTGLHAVNTRRRQF
jgi:hypothetical protein